MAYIGHRCGCGHLDMHHKPGTPKSACEHNAGASCGKGCRKSTRAVLVPTFNSKAELIERVVRPGERLGDDNGFRTCDCPNCQALYADLTAA